MNNDRYQDQQGNFTQQGLKNWTDDTMKNGSVPDLDRTSFSSREKEIIRDRQFEEQQKRTGY
jgi:hypothetical protein